MELEKVSWYCAMCDHHLNVPYSGPRLPFRESPRRTALRHLLAKVEDHIDFHAWQLGNEIDSRWLEEQEQEDE